jgi:hypothetical protein
MYKVLNARQVGRRPAPDRVYVGRPSKWGQFVIGRDGSRDEVIAKYAHGSPGSQHSWRRCTNCAGRISCAPERCHAHMLIELANR